MPIHPGIADVSVSESLIGLEVDTGLHRGRW